MTTAMIGGILLMIGAFWVYKGNIFRSVMFYTVADIIWIMLALQAGDFIGAGMITVGGLLGFMAFLKMHKGEFKKTIV